MPALSPDVNDIVARTLADNSNQPAR